MILGTALKKQGSAEMHTLIVHCHPEPASFNAALTELARHTLRQQGGTVEVSDLYREGFDPCEHPDHYRNRENRCVFSPLREQRHAFKAGTLPHEVQREISRLERADQVILQFPVWWHSCPAMLKGWFDRVLVSGGLYTSTKRYSRGHFSGKTALCSVTTGAPEIAFGPGCRAGDIDRILWSTLFSLHYMGFRVLPPFAAFGIQGHGFSYTPEDSYQQLLDVHRENWRKRLIAMDRDAPLAFPNWEDWDDHGRARSA